MAEDILAQRGSYATARRVAALVWGLCVLIAVAALILLVIGPGRVLPSDIFAGVGGLSFLILALTFASVGAIVARRVPENTIGWIFLLTGLANSVQLLSWQYADVGLRATHRFAGATAAAVFNTVIGEATAGLLGLSLLLFPDGRLPSRRWRPALGGLLLGMTLLVLAGTLRPGRYAEPFAQVSNPFGLAGARGVMDAVDLAGWLFVMAGIGLGAVAMVVRLRRARGLERQQLKLVLAVGSVAAAAAALVMTTWFIWPTGHLQVRIAVLGVCFASVPLVAGVAILRYRLYEIDVVVNRTLVYAAVTVILAAAFAATVVLLGTALGRGSGWATAGATLVVAVAFRPLRARVQDAVDRRFNRARYDGVAADGRLPRGPARRPGGPRGGRGRPAGGVVRPAAGAPLLSARERALRRRARTTRLRLSQRRAAAGPGRARRRAARHRAPRARERGRPHPAAQGRRGRGACDRDRAAASRATPPTGRGRSLARADRRGRKRRASADRARPPRRRPAAARLDRADATPRPARARVGVAGARRPDPRRRGRRDRRRDRRAARARARAAAVAARRRAGAGLPRARPPSAAAGRGGRAAASVSAETSRRPPTSSAAKASPTPSSTPTPPRSSSARGGETGSSSSPSPTTASEARSLGRDQACEGSPTASPPSAAHC